MAYDWRPTANRAATTDPAAVAVPHHAPKAAARPSPPDDLRVDAVIDEFIEAAETGRAVNRSGRPYRPSALRDLRGTLRHHVAPELGELPLRDVRRRHVQALVDRLAADGLSVSRIRSVVSAVRALYGYAVERGYAEFTPADGLVIPPEGRADREPDAEPPAWDWTDDVEEPRERRERREPTPRRRGGGDFQPIALLPERILSLVLRIVVGLFILFALVTIAESM